MKLLKYALIIPILVGCNSQNSSISLLKRNAKHYAQASNTTGIVTKSAIVYYNLNKNRLNIKLINRNRLKDLEITECIINKKMYTPIEYDINELGINYYINLDKTYKKLDIKCKLSNNEIAKKTLYRYW